MIKLRPLEISALKGDKRALKELHKEQNRALKLIMYKEQYKKRKSKEIKFVPL